MRISSPPTTQFRGWAAIFDVVRRIGPLRLAAIVARRVSLVTESQDAPFTEDGALNYHSLAALSAVCLALAKSNDPPLNRFVDPLSETEAAEFEDVVEQLNDRWGDIYRRKNAVKLTRREQILWETYRLWVQTVAASYRNLSGKFEVARAWLLAHADLREQLESSASDEVSSMSIPFDSAYEAVEFPLLVAFALRESKGVSSSVEHLFSQSEVGLHIHSFLELVAPTIEAEAPSISDVEGYPIPWALDGLVRAPVLRHGSTLLAPDPSVLFATIGRRTLALMRPLLTARGMSSSAVGHVYGGVVERHVLRILRQVARLHTDVIALGAPTRAEGVSGEGWPDAFVLGPRRCLVVEVKGTRLPSNVDAVGDAEPYLAWIDKVMGARDAEDRGPLEQGALFFERWEAADPELTSVIGPPRDRLDLIYLIVCVDDPVPVLWWQEFRDHVLRPRLRTNSAVRLEHRTCFSSLRDLDVLLMVSSWAEDRDVPFSPIDAVFEWRRAMRRRGGARQSLGDEELVLPSLGDWLLVRWPESRGHFPEPFRSAWREAMKETRRVSF